VGFVERSDIVKYLFSPQDGSLVVICGPPVFEAAMTKTLLKVGFDKSQYYSYSEGDNVAAHL
jgi:ferredoxin-NADP reductase